MRPVRTGVGRLRTALAIILTAVLLAVPLHSVAGADGDDLDLSLQLAPVAPDGFQAGAQTDFVINLRSVDPAVPGIGLATGGTVRVTLPEQFVNEGVLPVASTGSGPTCAPPLITGCSTAVLLQGWPQSPQPPFPSATWESATNTVVLTANADWPAGGPDAPGMKQVHLILLGFSNPDRPGQYEIQVDVQPDPAVDAHLSGSVKAIITRNQRPTVASVSLAAGAPPPPFNNTLFQNVAAGDTSLPMQLYLWDADLDPMIGADFDAGSARNRALYDANGRVVGRVRVDAPSGAADWSLQSDGPAVPAAAFVTGRPTATMNLLLDTDPAVSGTYEVEVHLVGGNRLTHRITARD